jgi:hypothetical protein
MMVQQASVRGSGRRTHEPAFDTKFICSGRCIVYNAVPHAAAVFMNSAGRKAQRWK